MELQQVHANIPHVSVKYLVKILETACIPGCKPDETRRLYRMGTMEGRTRFFLYYSRDVFTIAPELEQQMEKTNKAPMPEDEDLIGPEVDPFTLRKSATNVSHRAGTVSAFKLFLSLFEIALVVLYTRSLTMNRRAMFLLYSLEFL
jgi:hypothetical protein